MYLLPQEVEVWYIIPAIRKEMSRVLVEKYELSYEKTGALIGVTKAAVSQYISNKRATKMKLPDWAKKEVEKSAEIIVADNKRAIREIQRILRLMRKKKCSCSICKKYNTGIEMYCDCNGECE